MIHSMFKARYGIDPPECYKGATHLHSVHSVDGLKGSDQTDGCAQTIIQALEAQLKEDSVIANQQAAFLISASTWLETTLEQMRTMRPFSLQPPPKPPYRRDEMIRDPGILLRLHYVNEVAKKMYKTGAAWGQPTMLADFAHILTLWAAYIQSDAGNPEELLREGYQFIHSLTGGPQGSDILEEGVGVLRMMLEGASCIASSRGEPISERKYK